MKPHTTLIHGYGHLCKMNLVRIERRQYSGLTDRKTRAENRLLQTVNLNHYFVDEARGLPSKCRWIKLVPLLFGA